MPDSHDKRGWALELASRGFYIFPLIAERKVPNTLWKNVRTCDPEQISAWFDHNPNMNYGVCPGSGGAIIDVDTKREKRGLEQFQSLEREQDLGDMVRGCTFTVQSPSKGLHFYLTTEEPVTNFAGFGEGIDVRGEGGYVVGPGCYYNGQDKEGDVAGFYEVQLDVPFKAAPAWCLDRMKADILKNKRGADLIELDLPESINQAKEFLTHHPPAVEKMLGGGDMHTFKTAAALCYNFGLSAETALELAAHWRFLKPGEMEPLSWNERCEPPWEVYGSGNETLETKFKNGSCYGQGQRGQMAGAIYIQGLDIETIQQATEAAIQMASVVDEKRARLEHMLLRGEGIFNAIPPMRWIIPFWLPGAGITGIVGESGIGKSTIMLDLALRLAHDMDWHSTATRKGMTIVYACGEDSEGAVVQTRAWCKAHDIKAPNEDRFVFIPAAPPLASIDEANLWASVLREKVGKKDVMLFIDTWQRATVGLSQNDEKEMQGALNLAEAFGRQLGGPCVVVFHSPKHNRQTISGWEGQRNSSNALWFIESDARGVKLTGAKIRGGQRGNFVVFSFKECSSGLKDDYFGFELPHVIPERIAGMKITADGMVYEELDAEKVRVALADVLYELEAHRSDDYSANHLYSPGHAAERIVGHPEHRNFAKPCLALSDDPWAVEQIEKLKAVGLRFPCSHQDMLNLIKTHITPGGVVLPDGRLVALSGNGDYQGRITCVRNALDVQETVV